MKLELRRKRDLGRILDDSFSVYRANFVTLLLIAAAVVVPVYLLVYGVGLGWLWSGYETRVTGTELELADVSDQLVGITAQLLVVTPLVTAMTVHLVRTAAEEQRAAARDAIAVGLDLFPKLLLTVALFGLGVIGGFMLLIVPGVILMVRWLVISQVVVVEGRGGTEALRRSFDLTRGRFWASLLVLFVLSLLAGLAAAVVQAPLEYAAEQADMMALSLLGQVLGSVLTLPLVAVAYTLLYFSLVAETEGPGPAFASTPVTYAPPGGPSTTSDEPTSLPGVPGTFGDGWAPPSPPDR